MHLNLPHPSSQAPFPWLSFVHPCPMVVLVLGLFSLESFGENLLVAFQWLKQMIRKLGPDFGAGPIGTGQRVHSLKESGLGLIKERNCLF